MLRCYYFLLIKFILLFVVLGLTPLKADTQFPRNQAVPGGIALINIQSPSKPKAYYNSSKLLVLQPNPQKPNQWQAVVGIPIFTKVGEKHITLVSNGAKKSIFFNVNSTEYKKQYIAMKNKNFVLPNLESWERIKKDRINTKKSYRNWQLPTKEITANHWAFSLPLKKGVVSGEFGNRRYFNNQPRKPHSGIDIAAPKDTPVFAVSSGQITLVSNLFFNGNAIFLDHGFGVVSVYFHLHKALVKVGQVVSRGQKIALVGQTGRSTGDHLHFGVSVNGALVNPELFYTSNKFAEFYKFKSAK